jgi:hypothetical protein
MMLQTTVLHIPKAVVCKFWAADHPGA